MDEPSEPVIYQFKVLLVGISPMIWRRLLVPSDCFIADFHYIIQIAMGWTDSHLHRFVIHGKQYGIAQVGGIWFSDNPWQVKLSDFGFRVRGTFSYEYDFGDNWQHQIRVEAILPEDPKHPYPTWGCKPKSQKIPSAQIQPCHDRIQVDDLPSTAG